MNKWFRFDWLLITAVALLAIMGVALNGVMSVGERGRIVTMASSEGVLMIERLDEQPLKLVQGYSNQLVGQFLLTSDVDSVDVSKIVFAPAGNIGSTVFKYPKLFPIKIRVGDEIVAETDLWQRSNESNALRATARLTSPITVSPNQPLKFDVLVDISPWSAGKTFGVAIMSIGAETIVETDMPAYSKTFRIFRKNY